MYIARSAVASRSVALWFPADHAVPIETPSVRCVDPVSSGFVEVGGDHDELVATQARHRVGEPHHAEQALRDVFQHLVAGLVAQAVVDVLEAVEVQEQHGHLAAVALGTGQRLRQAVRQQLAVRQAGQCVVVRQLCQFGLVRLKLAHQPVER